MADIPSGTIFAAIAPNTDVDKKSALINEKSLTYTIEDIAAAAGGDLDLSEYLKIVDAASTYQTLSGMSSYLTSADAMGIYQPISGMSSYLTTANAASTYQSKFIIGNSQQLFVTTAVPDGVIGNLGTSNVASGTTRGSFQIQCNQPLSAGGVVYFSVNLDTVNGNARVIVSPRVSIYTQLITCCVSQIGTNFFQVLVKNIGFSPLSDFESVFVDFIVVK